MSLVSYCMNNCIGVTEADKDLVHRFDKLAHEQDAGLANRLGEYRRKSAILTAAIDKLHPLRRRMVLQYLDATILAAMRHALATNNAHLGLIAIRGAGTHVAEALGVNFDEEHGAV